MYYISGMNLKKISKYRPTCKCKNSPKISNMRKCPSKKKMNFGDLYLPLHLDYSI